MGALVDREPAGYGTSVLVYRTIYMGMYRTKPIDGQGGLATPAHFVRPRSNSPIRDENVPVVILKGVAEFGIPSGLPVNYNPVRNVAHGIAIIGILFGEICLGFVLTPIGILETLKAVNTKLLGKCLNGLVSSTLFGEFAPGNIVAIGVGLDTILLDEVADVTERIARFVHHLSDVALDICAERSEPFARGHGAEQVNSGSGSGEGNHRSSFGLVHESNIHRIRGPRGLW
jgi:hypothetical protein